MSINPKESTPIIFHEIFQAKNEVEKSKRKIEGDLRVSQEAVAELERSKAELAQSIQRKDREFGAVMSKIEDEASLGSKQQKQIKELAVSSTSCTMVKFNSGRYQ